VFTGIEELAQSIALCGLLENLVVMATTSDLIAEGFELPYTLVAGERRLRALKLLSETVDFVKVPPSVATARPLEPIAEDWPVPCLIVEENEDILGLVENIQREDVPIWQLGHKYLEVLSGYSLTQDGLSAYLGKDPGYVSKAIRIAQGLHPDIEDRLNRLGPRALTQAKLLVLSRLVSPDGGEPDLKAQTKKLHQFLYAKAERRGGKASKPGEMRQRDRVWRRFYNLRSGRVPVPPEHIPLVDAIVAYLDGITPKLELP